MNKTSGMKWWFLAGLLVSLLAVGACGDDDPCTKFCDRAQECDGEDHDKCMSQCEKSEYPEEFVDCVVDLSCNPSDKDVEACVKEIEVTKACKDWCAKPCAKLIDDGDAVWTCERSCSFALPKAAQACLAKVNGETCEGAAACMEGLD
ncbi:MAG TPA: hypothetical protein VKY51_07570 [Fredinandcohnia sp.]|nr:hypothetical protein [Fredinandcohnia sp.]